MISNRPKINNVKPLSNWREPQGTGNVWRELKSRSFLSHEGKRTSEKKKKKRKQKVKEGSNSAGRLIFLWSWGQTGLNEVAPYCTFVTPGSVRSPQISSETLPPAPAHPALFVLLILAPRRAPNYGSAEEHPSPFSPKPPARAEISGQLTWRRPSGLVPIWLWINDEPRLSLPEPIYQNRQLGCMMIKHPDVRSPQGPGPLLHHGLQLDLIAGVFSALQEDKETFKRFSQPVRWQELQSVQHVYIEKSIFEGRL